MSRQASGLRAWALQRITAVYIGIFTLYIVGHFIVDAPASYAVWKAWISSPIPSLGILLFILSVLLHSWIGMRDILIDYVHPFVPRIGLLILVGIGLVVCGLWAIKVIIIAGAIS